MKWTSEEIKILVTKYGKISNHELSLILNRKPQRIQEKAARLGLKFENIGRPWLPHEDEVVKNFYGKISTIELAQKLNRTTHAIINRTIKLHIKYTPDIVDGKKKCPRCDVVKDVDQFDKCDNHKNGFRRICKKCIRKRNICRIDKSFNRSLKIFCKQCHLEKSVHEYSKSYSGRYGIRDICKICQGFLDRNKYLQLKEIIFNRYGRKCACLKCPETNVKFLTIEHKLGVDHDVYKSIRRKNNRSAGIALYNWIIKNNFPDTIELLCWNCNVGKDKNGNICPHMSLNEDLVYSNNTEPSMTI